MPGRRASIELEISSLVSLSAWAHALLETLSGIRNDSWFYAWLQSELNKYGIELEIWNFVWS